MQNLYQATISNFNLLWNVKNKYYINMNNKHKQGFHDNYHKNYIIQVLNKKMHFSLNCMH